MTFPGFQIFLDEGRQFLQWVQREYPGVPVFVMGHSMGALIATHLGLGHFADQAAVQGFILSSPYYVNAIKVSPVLLALAGVLGALAPRMKVPLAPLTDQLTHDAAITARHYADEKDDIRATEITVPLRQCPAGGGRRVWPRACRPGASRCLPSSRATTSWPMRAPARPCCAASDPALLTLQIQPHNYHENFNEVNRETDLCRHPRLDRGPARPGPGTRVVGGVPERRLARESGGL